MIRPYSYGVRFFTAIVVVMVVAVGAYLPMSAPHAQAVGADLTFETNPALLGGIAATAVAAADQTLISKVLNTLAWTVAKVAIQSMTKSIVNWINGGFEGSPAFETDLNNSLRKLGDGVAQGFLTQIINDEAVHSPFIDNLVTNVGAAYYLYSSRDAISAQLQYTLAKTSPNPQAFQAGDFNQGGWNAWMSTFQNPANNPYGAQMIASQALANQISVAANQRVAELAWGKGFLSWKGDCLDTGANTGGNTGKNSSTPAAPAGSVGVGTGKNSGGSTGTATVPTQTLSDKDQCLNRETKTPGSVIESALISNVNSPLHQLELADSINEIVGALATQLVSKVLGGNGLSGVSKPSQGGGRSDLSLATDPSQYTGSVTSASDGFISGLSASKAKIETYRSAWQKIQTAAQQAKSVCGSSSLVDGVLAKSAAALTRANEASTALASIQTRTAALQSSGEQAAELTAIIQEYLKLPLPTPEDTTEATTESQDTGAAVPGSLYSQMVRLSNPLLCAQAGN